MHYIIQFIDWQRTANAVNYLLYEVVIIYSCSFPETSGIYMIRNKINGKVYIGQAQNLNIREYNHIHDLRKGTHHNKHLQAAWDKYTEQNFEFSIVELCDVDKLNEREKFYINELDTLKDGYNQTEGGVGARGRKASEETRRRLSEHNPRALKVVLVNTGEVFDCVLSAAKKYSVSKSDISRNAKHKSHSAGSLDGERLVWAYYDDYVNMTIDKKKELLYIAQNCKKASFSPHSTPVICITTGIVYCSMREAAKEYMISETNISATCRGIQRHAGGVEWAYYDDTNRDVSSTLNG